MTAIFLCSSWVFSICRKPVKNLHGKIWAFLPHTFRNCQSEETILSVFMYVLNYFACRTNACVNIISKFGIFFILAFHNGKLIGEFYALFNLWSQIWPFFYGCCMPSSLYIFPHISLSLTFFSIATTNALHLLCYRIS